MDHAGDEVDEQGALNFRPRGLGQKTSKRPKDTPPNDPIIADADFAVSKLYGMLPTTVEGDPKTRTPADNQTVRSVFVVGPDKNVKLILVYPMTTGRNFDEVLRVIDSHPDGWEEPKPYIRIVPQP